MTIQYHNCEQGTQEWLNLRCGIITASEIGQLITPTGSLAKNDKVKALYWKKLAERVTGYVEPTFQTFAMERGHQDEVRAREAYAHHHMFDVEQVGFITNDEHGFTLGYSPDGIVDTIGLIECKSRDPKFQIEVLISGEVPKEHQAQLQYGLLTTEREWIDYCSFSAGMNMAVIPVLPDEAHQKTILEAVKAFEDWAADMLPKYEDALRRYPIKTERIWELEAVEI